MSTHTHTHTHTHLPRLSVYSLESYTLRILVMSTLGHDRVLIPPHDRLKNRSPPAPSGRGVHRGEKVHRSVPTQPPLRTEIPCPSPLPLLSESPHREVGGWLGMPRSSYHITRHGTRYTALAISVRDTNSRWDDPVQNKC